jgi:hypothetical protein
MSSEESVLNRRRDLRAAVAAVDRAVDALGRDGTTRAEAATAPLIGSWKVLVDILDLGSAPALRACPRCGHTGMRAATRCGFCWIALVPPAEPERAAAHAAAP